MQTRPDTPEPHEPPGEPAPIWLETVAHCWRYSRLLRFHLSGFVLNPPHECHLTATVFYCPEDQPVLEVLREFGPIRIPRVRWNFIPLDAPRLCRRAIGRNLAALATTADHVLFCDVDYVFTGGALDGLARDLEEVRRAGPYLGFCRTMRASISHELGDAEIERAGHGGVLPLFEPRYEASGLSRPIGGSQFILGDWAREHGYIPDHPKHQRPAKRWLRTFCDRAFRYSSGLRLVPLECPRIYRIRHSKRGRFDVGVEL